VGVGVGERDRMVEIEEGKVIRKKKRGCFYYYFFCFYLLLTSIEFLSIWIYGRHLKL